MACYQIAAPFRSMGAINTLVRSPPPAKRCAGAATSTTNSATVSTSLRLRPCSTSPRSRTALVGMFVALVERAVPARRACWRSLSNSHILPRCYPAPPTCSSPPFCSFLSPPAVPTFSISSKAPSHQTMMKPSVAAHRPYQAIAVPFCAKTASKTLN